MKSYRAKVNHFKKIFDGTPVDTDRLLVGMTKLCYALTPVPSLGPFVVILLKCDVNLGKENL